jgi:ribosomal protein S18 acetylase RimI-like enzyme
LSQITLFEGWKPGALGFLVAEHGRSYARDWGFGASFEAKVAAGLGDFQQRYNTSRDRVFLALDGEVFVGGLAIDGHYPDHPGEARLRWFILAEAARGRGIGNLLMKTAMAHVDSLQAACTLGTFAGLDAARALYEKHGFVLTSENEGRTWGVAVREQEFRRPARS